MPNLEEVYKRLEKNKKRKREIGKMIMDELSHSSRYKEIKEELMALREEKKAIEQTVQAGNPDFKEIEELKAEIQTDSEVLSDLALNMYMKDQTVEIVDDYDQKWYPQFKVAFKKGNG
ncbi:hypothetical protein A3C09_00360 [Candidatus Uhrbacteria bacterium RIFCSPHIGHO2_02_FULL_47_44]|uniref:Uncharacterized protein n=1 Tax=Candidatus Uhrbacteria bacterium RIFCSPLOWO2_02_FULL_48_18 TaxID=1802408 RepID=A0A1F7VAK8_9BACT|nr:MAG: hypothetical protein A2839_00325 [Candidatus Uhrbacteria bacterium RIFCSPHIGHO2_01_FULL_47_10]OGL69901.1 MAG: hypothetical protein A3C09_00360 [Candidatus Uhrbacteria bacterium RIFCSPHIGHO2_02_FULL_47_44]OGL76176.1 MAG: hypothetical protein A3E97_03005 [Candidatus Uhrbacteria bacterium RIFCSPHIGHO2_12_FULL_47_12]OGL81904.1 MAG: hypothetical protein A3B20_02350 [Candidatus Uhrbacteria bacterium RIFCSPLOWO2_01_FULL_47_17]OGL87067.1 MAG: hypothetical protein A3I41_03940 [Candidatus Uhrbact